MAKYVPDSRTQRWVVIAQRRTARPSNTQETAKPKVSVDPFAEGNEHLTPPEVYRIGPGEKDKPGWHVRVVPNKYPITDVHEVIIHSPDAEKDIEGLGIEQVTHIVTCYRDRYRANQDSGQVLIFCNHGEHAGASLRHPHSQLVVVPKQINLDALSREPITNIVEETSHFVSYCPDFSQWPFELWIAPKDAGGGKFSDIHDEELKDVALVLKRNLQAIEAVYHDKSLSLSKNETAPFGYNFYISHGTNWFIRIIPRFVHRAGFELGTGLSVNITDPLDAARVLSFHLPK